MKRIITLYLFLLNLVCLCAANLPELPPSPQAREFMKYVDYPVNYSTGLPDVTIPLYTIKSSRLTIPIALNYHASGFKPNERYGIVGQGWSLNASHRISRTINSMPDEKCLTNLIKDEYTDFPYRCDQAGPMGIGCIDIYSDPEALYLRNQAGCYSCYNQPDAEYDLFYYSYPGGNGRFIYERNEQNQFKPILLPYKATKIDTHSISDGSRKDITHYDVFDESGNMYRYGKSIIANQDVTETGKNFDYTMHESRSTGKTSWLLTEIISADKSDTIFYEYTQPVLYKEYHIPFTKSISHTVQSGEAGLWNTNVSAMSAAGKYEFTQVQLSKIRFKSGEMRFNYSNNELPRLSSIEVFEKSQSGTRKIQNIALNINAFDYNGYWYKLDDVKISDPGNSVVQKYSFLYNEMTRFPTMRKIYPDANYYETYSIDYWGFYNGTENTMLLPSIGDRDPYRDHPELRHIFGTANRDTNPTYAKQGVLRQIIYPTGGSTSFEYEANVTSYGAMVGGIRVNKITNNSESGLQTRVYKYGESVSAIGEPSSILNNHNAFKSVSYSSHPSGGYTATYTLMSSPQIPYYMNSQPIVYTTVTELYGDENENLGKVVRKFDRTSLMTGADFEASFFLSFDLMNKNPWYGISSLLDINFGNNVFFQRKYRFGDLQEKEIVFYDPNGAIKKKITRNYQNHVRAEYKGLLAKQAYTSSIEKNHYYWKKNYSVLQLNQQLLSETVQESFNDSPTDVTTTTGYEYNDLNLIKSTETVSSNGKSHKTQFFYPFDFDDSVNRGMVSRNIMSAVVQKKQFTDNLLVKTTQTEYAYWNNRFYAPSWIRESTKLNEMEDRVQFVNYDHLGNPLYIMKDGEMKFVYLWGYSGKELIAEIKNASYSEVSTALGVAPEVLSSYKTPNFNLIESLRDNNLLINALITTLTYDPMYGVTSIKDSKKMTTYYEYDGIGRLKETYFKSGNVKNILQAFKYNYANK